MKSSGKPTKAKTKLTWTENAEVDVEVLRDQNIVLIRPRKRVKERSVWWLGISMFIHAALAFVTRHNVALRVVKDLEGYIVCEVFFLTGIKRSLSGEKRTISLQEQHDYDFGWLLKVGYDKDTPYDFKRYLAKDIESTARFLKNHPWKKVKNEFSRFRQRTKKKLD